jgi:hypothetical protein
MSLSGELLQETQLFCDLNLIFCTKERVMETKGKIAAKKEDIRYNEFLKYLQKRLKELERDEKKFRESILKERKVN